MQIRKILVSLGVCLCAVGLAFCGGKGQQTRPDTGRHVRDTGPAAECQWTYDCPEGDCVDGQCVKCTATSCATGNHCSADFKCVSCDGGCGGADASVQTCAKRADCPAGLVCHNGKCQAKDSAGRCVTVDECPTGEVCNYNDNVCIVGCFSNADCVGLTLDGGVPAPHCDGVTNQCGPCVDGNDCALGETCTNQVCQKAPECVPPDRSPCGDRACVEKDGGGYICGPCTDPSQCGTGKTCDQFGKCVEKPVGCTRDDQCKNYSPGHYCEISTGICQWGCLPDQTDAGGCGVNCCSADAGDTCNLSTHQCGGGSTCTDCNPACGMGETCDMSTCTCRSGSADGGGGFPGSCDSTTCAGCGAGESCMCFGAMACSPPPGIGCCLPVVGCVMATCEVN